MKNRFTRFALSASVLGMLAACSTPSHDHATMGSMPTAGSTAAPLAPVASARLLTSSGQPGGDVTFAPGANGVELVVDAQGLKPGPHGFHVHANGSCAPGPDGALGQVVDFGAAGGHFDPGNSRNHGRPGDDKAMSHAGELPVLQAASDGRATLRYTNANLSLDRGAGSVIGRTVVVHADPDDYVSDPAGNSGARILCGAIQASGLSLVKGRATLEGSQVFPEGIAVDARSGDAFVGSSVNGDIFRIKPGMAKGELLQAGGAVGRQAAFGMKVDSAGRLWVAGGPSGALALVDTTTSATLAVWKAPADVPSFLNDLVITRDGNVYVTDSFRPVLYRLRPTAGSAVALEPWLDLSKTPIRYKPNEINLNGIVASPDGRYLLSVQLATGQLWRIDTQSKAVMQVRIEGDLTAGDGLVLVGAHLWVMRNAHHELARVRLAVDWGSGRVEQRVTDSRLNYPTTAAMSSAGLMVANGQLDRQKNPPVLLPFDVVTVELPRSSP